LSKVNPLLNESGPELIRAAWLISGIAANAAVTITILEQCMLDLPPKSLNECTPSGMHEFKFRSDRHCGASHIGTNRTVDADGASRLKGCRRVTGSETDGTEFSRALPKNVGIAKL
jgi:hypothetical protein